MRNVFPPCLFMFTSCFIISNPMPEIIDITVAVAVTVSFICAYSLFWTKYFRKKETQHYFLRYENRACQKCLSTGISSCNSKTCSLRVLQMVIKYIDEAEKYLLICMPTVSERRFQDAVLRANDRQVRIRLITSEPLTPPRFCLNGIPVKGHDGKNCHLMHSKFIVIDDRLLIRSSLCFSESTFRNGSCENLQVIYDKPRIEWYQAVFNENWQSDGRCSQCKDNSRVPSITMSVPLIKLNNGRSMPALGLGTWMASPGEVGNAVKLAIDAGYRHIDCALLYQNEQEIGRAIREKIADGTVKREELFITSKLWQTYHSPDLVIKGCQKSLRNFGLDYLDLYLVHWPFAFKATDKADAPSKELGTVEGIFSDEEFMPRDENGQLILTDEDYVDTWYQMEKCVELGLAKSIGLSNFNVEQIGRILAAAKIPPVTNQIEVHPYLTQKEIREFCNEKGIVVTGYCPLGSARENLGYVKILDHETVKGIAAKVEKTPAQIVLRYLIQLGVVPIPKSTNPSRLRLNLSVFDFELSQDQVQALAALDSNKRACPFVGVETHKFYPFPATVDVANIWKK